MRSKEGLILADGLVGEPIETDDYTKNVSSLNVAHVKVEANLCKPLPTAGELIGENGVIIDVDIDYPWTPPLCTHCCHIDHIIKNYIYPAAKVHHPDNAATSSVSVSLQGYSLHVQIEKEVQSNTSPPLSPDTDSPVVAASDDMMHDEVTVAIESPAAPATLDSDSQLGVDLILDATTFSLEPEIILPPPNPLPQTSSYVLTFSSPIKTTPLAKSSPPSPKSSRSSTQKALSLTNSTPSSPPPALTFTSSAPFFVGLPATFAPTSTSYIAKRQAASFKSPPINLPLFFFDQSFASWQATSAPLCLLRTPSPSQNIFSSTDPGGSFWNTKITFWNVCGLNDPTKHQPFSQWLYSQRTFFCALLETRIKEQNLNSLMQQLCPGWSYTSNHASDADGRVIIIWNHPVSIQVLGQSRQSFTCVVSLATAISFTFTAVYAANTEAERSDLWVELLRIQQTFSLLANPWALEGDSNQIMHHSEHSSNDVNILSASMIEFSDCLHQADLFDLRYHGVLHSRFNKQPVSPITKKLDRLLVNQAWISSHPHSLATFLPPNFSDHSPCSLDLALPLPVAGTKPFQFFNFLTLHPDFVQLVEDFWIQAGGRASFLGDLC